MLSILVFLLAYSSAVQAPAAAEVERQRGVSWTAKPYEVTRADLAALVEHNIGWIVQTPFGWQRSLDSGEVRLKTSGVFWGETDEGLETTTRLAKQLGIKTLLKPHLWLSPRDDGKWRADIAMRTEESWRAWFASYRRFILHYARLAQRLGIEALCIGTELHATFTNKPEEWERVIREVRKAYGGKLTYAANWHREFEEFPLWQELDYIGIQAYFPLGEAANPSVEQLKTEWRRHMEVIERVRLEAGKPVLFTEIGYKSTPGSTREPWLWLDKPALATYPVDHGVQERAYRAFFETFWDKEWFAGAYFWKWHPRAGNGNDPDFSPQGKPAAAVLTEWYGRAAAPGAPAR